MLKTVNLKKQYKSFCLNCTLQVQKGRITGLIGQNGAGKSTTFKAILGLINTDGGDITVFGKDIKSLTNRDRELLGVVLSDSGFSGYFTVKDIIPILKNLYSKFDLKLFLSQAEKFSIPLNKQIKEFSTGMKVKLKILVAISHGAKMLILDEPTAGLDVIARDELLLILREYMEQDDERGILISSHISSDLEMLCDDLYLIDNGNIVLHEDTDLLLDSYGVLKLTAEQLEQIDKQYILSYKNEPYGVSCLTNQKRFYLENYSEITVEKGGIDSVITMLIKGEKP